jgi:putative tricarboxylic transport membrane protein
VRLSDVASGLLAAANGAAVALYSRTFPSMPGQPIGPGLFPLVVGLGLVAFGVTLMIGGLRKRESLAIELDDWVRRPRMRLHFVIVVADVIFYALVVDRLGFFITAFLFLSTLLLAFDVKRTWIAPTAAAVTLVIHYGFYTLLRVPLPWGILGGIAW